VHVVAFVAGKPDETVRVARPELHLEILAVASSVVRRGQQLEVVHHPRVAVEVSPEMITGRQRWLRCRRVDELVGRHVVEQSLAVEVEVAHVAVEGSTLAAA